MISKGLVPRKCLFSKICSPHKHTHRTSSFIFHVAPSDFYYYCDDFGKRLMSVTCVRLTVIYVRTKMCVYNLYIHVYGYKIGRLPNSFCLKVFFKTSLWRAIKRKNRIHLVVAWRVCRKSGWILAEQCLCIYNVCNYFLRDELETN